MPRSDVCPCRPQVIGAVRGIRTGQSAFQNEETRSDRRERHSLGWNRRLWHFLWVIFDILHVRSVEIRIPDPLMHLKFLAEIDDRAKAIIQLVDSRLVIGTIALFANQQEGIEVQKLPAGVAKLLIGDPGDHEDAVGQGRDVHPWKQESLEEYAVLNQQGVELLQSFDERLGAGLVTVDSGKSHGAQTQTHDDARPDRGETNARQQEKKSEQGQHEHQQRLL